MDGFREVGPGKHFFGAQHTLRHYETGVLGQLDGGQLELRAVARRRRAAGRGAGRRQGGRAAARYEPPPIDDAVDEALRDFMARRKAEMPDMWP